MSSDSSHPLVVAITGASGVVYGIRTLQVLRQYPEVETHLILTTGARLTITQECDISLDEVRALADVEHAPTNVGASVASGSFPARGMLVAPCSVKSLSAIANSYADNLVARAADVMLKERRPLVLLFRETPLHAGHIRLMADATASGATVMPPVPAFYHRPRTIDDVIDQTVGRMLDQVGIDAELFERWQGPRRSTGAPATEAPKSLNS